VTPPHRRRARDLRRRATDAERALWRHLRSRPIAGLKFRRQHPIGRYIVDFACLDAMLVIELDGSQHRDNAEQDADRTALLNALGWRVLRFWNSDVVQNPDGVFRAIVVALAESPPSPRPSPPTAVGGEGASLP